MGLFSQTPQTLESKVVKFSEHVASNIHFKSSTSDKGKSWATRIAEQLGLAQNHPIINQIPTLQSSIVYVPFTLSKEGTKAIFDGPTPLEAYQTLNAIPQELLSYYLARVEQAKKSGSVLDLREYQECTMSEQLIPLPIQQYLGLLLLNGQIAQLNEKKNSIESQLEQTKNSIEREKVQLKNYSTNLEALDGASGSGIAARKTSLTANIKKFGGKIDELNATLTEQQSTVEHLNKTLEPASIESKVETILGSTTPLDGVSRGDSLDYHLHQLLIQCSHKVEYRRKPAADPFVYKAWMRPITKAIAVGVVAVAFLGLIQYQPLRKKVTAFFGENKTSNAESSLNQVQPVTDQILESLENQGRYKEASQYASAKFMVSNSYNEMLFYTVHTAMLHAHNGDTEKLRIGLDLIDIFSKSYGLTPTYPLLKPTEQYLQTLKEVALQRPNDVELKRVLSHGLRSLGKYDQALAFGGAIQLSPTLSHK